MTKMDWVERIDHLWKTRGLEVDFLAEKVLKRFGELDRQARRAITPAGFAKAFFEANSLEPNSK